MIFMENVDYLIQYLLEENPEVKINKTPININEKFNLYRSLCNVRQAKPISDEFIQKEEEFLEEIIKNKNITSIDDIDILDKVYPNNNQNNGDKLCLWRGDITSLKSGAIVNAANSQGLGCFIPGHNCIDNQINTYAGIPLRLECNEHMKTLNYNLPTGEAFITKAYNLPSDYVIHTVGPIIQSTVTNKHEELLANCYKNCLRLAQKNNIRSLAFCSISTGVFRFPKDLACQIALKTVNDYLNEYGDNFDKIVFNVYSKEALEIYENFI